MKLKLAAKAELAAAQIAPENDANLVLFADATNCAMLKEIAMDYFVANAEAVMKSNGFKEVQDSADILSELLDALVAGKKRYLFPVDPNNKDYQRMRVPTLRAKLDKKGLEVDGSKEMLISRLKEADDFKVDNDCLQLLFCLVH